MALVAPVAAGAAAAAAAGTARPGATTLGVVRTAPAGATTQPGAAVSRLVQMQARFQKKQMEEKEQKLLRLYESQQQRAYQRVGRGSAGSCSSSVASLSSSNASTLAGSMGPGGGKVRQLFEERRSNGWDRSYPLEPVAANNNNNKAAATTATAQQQQQQQYLPLAVPKTKQHHQLTRGASLDRSQHQQAPSQLHHQKHQPQTRRSKSHARAATDGFYGGGHQEAAAVTRRKAAGVTVTTGAPPRDAPQEHHLSRRQGGTRRQQPLHRRPREDSEEEEDEDQDEDDEEREEREGYAEDEDEEDGFHGTQQQQQQQQQQQRFINGDNHHHHHKRQEELFAKYQVREISPYDEGTFVYEKDSLHNGLNNNNLNNNNDRFKTYVSNKHNLNNNNVIHRGGGPQGFKDEIIPRATTMMATKGQDVKKGPAATRPAPPKKVEQTNASGSATTGSSALPQQRTSVGSSAAKKTPLVARPTSSPLSKNIHSNSGTKASPKAKNGPSAARSAPTRDDLTECPICHRRFTNDRIKVHQEICAKTSQKKRKEYDATKHRVQGTEAEQFVRRPMRAAVAQKKPEPKKADWRKKHEEFIQTIRAAKEAQAHVAAGGKLSDLPPPPPMDTSDYVQCPHCGRKFNEAAADRHIPRCANMQHNKPKPVSKPSGGGFNKRR